MNAKSNEVSMSPTPCPFCGSGNIRPYTHITEMADCYCQCDDCGTIGPSGTVVSEAGAIAAWNRRTLSGASSRITELERQNAELAVKLQQIRGLAEKWHKDAVDTGFAMSEPGYELDEVLDAAPHQQSEKEGAGNG